MAVDGSLTAKQERAILALLSEPTIEGAARVAAVGERSLYRWLSDDVNFQDALRKARREAVSHAIARLQHVSKDAVNTLRDIAADLLAPPPARVSAAKTILEFAVKAIEIEDVAMRLEKLERRANENPRPS